ncbi:G-patch-domain-containing protein [Westerdykella ornata]|uniref:G-patch-domain-containing protein n=1 Tax=Westerdykella ornata TaxID=318751 RepID=A0A6A6K1J8_WESOR|nr:G-patch-domain-containing protein [Westerdykella ornata]KAF2281249.1 G-patch-domain-containing protein [Westerdykella ornata]
MAHSDEEEDYMTMTFEDPKPKYETSLQRAARERREAEDRSRQKSKAELKEEEERARHAALSTALPTDNKGFKMMAKFGFKQGDALGKSENARKEPIHISLKEDRSGIGLESEKKRKFRERMEQAEREAKRSKTQELDYREAQRQRLKEKKLEADLKKAQRAAERLHGEKEKTEDPDKIPLKNINVLWRDLARERLEELREKKEKHQLLNHRLNKRSPVFNDEDDEEDADDKLALGREDAVPLVDDDLEEEDPELEEFRSLPLEERVQKLVAFLRDEYHYCYWCGHKYDDANMDGCPGTTEEEHD